MNRSAWMSALMKSNIPQNLMNMFGYKRKKSRSMTYSILGMVASAAAAFAFRNRMGDGMRQLFQNSNSGNMLNRPISSGLTEFAEEVTSGMMEGKTANHSTGYHSTSSTSPESSQIINQIASAVKQEGDSQQVNQMTDRLIKQNL
ncbi:hypothetical protein [Mesobacillus jeotgali]|uniref:hypothetical protein n=1 Tax=Mesobacillus jeotgali TaxID=129985 RepID=UPI0009A63B34|nr:hypothetical protein [Mesobacillus jeotgali]